MNVRITELGQTIEYWIETDGVTVYFALQNHTTGIEVRCKLTAGVARAMAMNLAAAADGKQSIGARVVGASFK